MGIVVPRAPRPAEAPEVIARLHGVQELALQQASVGRTWRKLWARHGQEGQGQPAARRREEARRAAGTEQGARKETWRVAGGKQGTRGRTAQERAAPGKAAQERAARGKAARPGRGKEQGFPMTAFLLCADAALFLFVLCALYAPDLLPAAPLGLALAGR